MSLTIPLIAANGVRSTITLPDAVVGLGLIIPAECNFAWNPGMMSRGGVPARTVVFSTLQPGNGIADDSSRIQTALDICPADQVVLLAAGTFVVNNYLLLHRGVTLRGSPGTILNKTNGARARTATIIGGTTGIKAPVDPASYSYDTQPVIIVGPGRWCGPDNTTSQNLTVDALPGATSITVANGAAFAAGTFVLLDEFSGASWQPTPVGFPSAAKVWQGDKVSWNMHQPVQQWQDDPDAAKAWFCRYDRPTCEIKEIKSVSGNIVTFTSPLTIGYRVGHTAQLTAYTAHSSGSGGDGRHIRFAGLENLTVVGGADGAVRFECAAYSWAKNVEVTQWIGEGIAINNSFRIEARDSKIHIGSWPEPGGAGYAISFANGSSEALIENSIMADTCKVMVFRCSGAGSVIGYNYADDAFDFDNPGWTECGINASHMAGPHHVLFEGNCSFNVDSDYTHGNAIYLTFFRNWLTGQRRSFTDASNPRCVGLAYGSWWDSFIGNVLGLPGKMAGWTYDDPAMTNNNAGWKDKVVWKLGYDPERWGMYPDTKTLSTVIRDGNFDFLTNAQRWHNTPGGFAMPHSMYLSAKPAFFGANPWPWVEPSSGTLYTLPAKARYDAGG